MDRFRGMKLDKGGAIAVASHEAIRGLLKEIVDEANARRSYLGNQVSNQAVVNGLVLYLRSLPACERAGIVDRSLKLCGDVQMDVIAPEDVRAMGAAGSSDGPAAGDKILGPFRAIDPAPSRKHPEGDGLAGKRPRRR